jgi:hypothetical protein
MRWADVISNEPPVDTSPAIPSPHGVGLKIVAFYFILPSAISLLTTVLLQTGALTPPPEQREMIDRLPTWHFIVSYSLMALQVTGGILLLLRYRIALPVLLLYGGITVAAWVFLPTVELSRAPGFVSFVVVASYSLLIVALVYVFILYRRGILYKTLASGAFIQRVCGSRTNSSP